MQDPNPLPWGALDRFQAQFIVRKNVGSSAIHYTAKTSLSTRGHFGSKVISKVEWNVASLLIQLGITFAYRIITNAIRHHICISHHY